MNSKFLLILFLLSPALLWAGDDLDKQITKFLKKEFPEEHGFTDSSFELTNEEVKVIEEKSRIKIHYNHFRLIKLFQNDTLSAKAIIFKVPSKTGDVSLFTLTDNCNKIKTIKIVDASDPRSFNLNSRLWIKQFKNKNISDHLRVGKDIDAMSGATISSIAATKAVKVSLSMMEYIDEQKKIAIQ